MSRAALVLTALLAAASGCGWRDEGIAIEVMASAALASPATSDATGLHWTMADGTAVHVTAAWVTVSSVELVACPVSGMRRLWNELGYGTAWAHTMSRPTRIGEPTVLAIAQGIGLHNHLGTFHPPAARYCTLKVTFAAADDDAAQLPTAIDMIGKTLWIDGTVTPPGGSATPFHVQSGGVITAELTLGPLVPDDLNLVLSQRIEVSPSRWLDGVDLGAGDPGPASLTALAATTVVW